MTTDRAGRRPTPSRPASRRITIGVRARILATVLVLAALGMTVAGVAFTLFEQRQLIGHIDGELTAEARRFERQARAATSSPEANVASILEEAVARPVPSDEVVLGMLDGKPWYVASGPRPFAIEEEADLVAEVAALSPGEPTRLRQIRTSVGVVRYVAVQLQVTEQQQRGTYVVARSLGPAQKRLAASARLYGELSAGALLLVAGGGWVVAGRLLRPLRLLRVAAENISHTDLTSRIPVSGARDDVTDLTRTVNAMLDRLQTAFDTQQQFLDDAGHELRTPLTIVRGHLEVLEVTDPAEVESTRRLAVDELDRMARLVSDLIILAQAGRPDFVRFEAVDLDRLLQTVLGKAEALADRVWLLDSTVDAVAVADEQRLTQAMLQLADNAARHTGPGEVIAVGGALSRAGVLLWVRDTGRGVAPEDVERIFERFGRSRSQRGRDGSGLGLSIVAGIAKAHSGRVTLEPQSPHGACFTLRLPLTIISSTDHPQPARTAPRLGRLTPPDVRPTGPDLRLTEPETSAVGGSGDVVAQPVQPVQISYRAPGGGQF